MTVAETVRLSREVPFGLIEFEERPPDPKTGRSYRAYHVTVDGERRRVSSVTTILRFLDKPALDRKREEVTATNAFALARTGMVETVEPADALAAMKEHGVDAESFWSKGKQRGIDIHTVLERYAVAGEAPNPADFPPELRGYIRGLVDWLLDDDPEPEAVEQLVANPSQKYAGRFDLRARIKGRSCLVDLKTNREGRIYPEAHLQARAYAIADEVCGAEPVQDIILVGVGERGNFERVRGLAKAADWKAIVDARSRLLRIEIAAREQRAREVAAA
jgi:genome maintenance exonuclease 1